MSLLLKALQNAAKNREAAAAGAQANAQPVAATQEVTPATASSSELTLEPVQQPASRAQPQSSTQPQSTPRTPPAYARSQTTSPLTDDAGERAAPSPAQAQNVLRAATPPRRAGAGVVQWISQRPLFAFSTAAGLFAIGYGVYLYLQITNPGVFVARRPPPAPPAVAQAPVAVPPVAPSAALTPSPLTPGAAPATPVAPGISTQPPAPGTAAAPAAAPAPLGTAPIAGLPGPGTPLSAPPAATAPGPALVAASRPPFAATTAAPQAAAAATRPHDVVATGGPGAAPAATPPTARPATRPRAATPARRESPEGVAPAAASQIIPVDANVASAYQALEKGQLSDAERLYRQALTSNPGSVDAMIGLASTLAQQNRADAATQLYMRVLEQEPRNSYAQAGLLALGGRADPVAAEARLKQLISREPSAYLHFTLGNLYSEQGLWAAAQGAYFQAHTLAPDNPDYAFNLAVGLEHLSQPRIALDYYRRALALAQTRGNAQFDPARVQSRIRSLETALVDKP